MNFIDQITNYIIRPSRERYHINRLGPRQIYIPVPHKTQEAVSYNSPHSNNYSYISIFRDDYSILTPQGKLLYYSYYTNHMAQHPDLCIIYLHANNGSRVQGLHYLEELFKCRYNVCLIDFTGSGWSEGDYVTLGCNQSHDLETVCRHMKTVKGINYVVLWGRSMGACTALMFNHKFKNNKAIGMVLDSPFKDLRKLVKQTAKLKTGLPQFFFQPILSFVDKQLEKKIGHRFEEYEMEKYIPSRSSLFKEEPIIPILFISSQMDKLVKPHHVQQLYDIYPGTANIDKFLYYIQNQHHQDRDQEAVRKCIRFIRDIVGKFYGERGFEQKKFDNGEILNGFPSFQTLKHGNTEHKYSLKSQQITKQSQLIAQINPPSFSFFSSAPQSASTLPQASTDLSTISKLEIFKQKEKRRRVLGIELSQKLQNQCSESKSHMKGGNEPMKRLSHPGAGRESYEEQRISLSKNIKIKMNQSYQNPDSNNQIHVESIKMIESFGQNLLAMNSSKKINLSGFKSPRDKFQEYYILENQNSSRKCQHSNAGLHANSNELGSMRIGVGSMRNAEGQKAHFREDRGEREQQQLTTYYSKARTHTGPIMNHNYEANLSGGVSFREYQSATDAMRPRQIDSFNLHQTKSQHNLLTNPPIINQQSHRSPFPSVPWANLPIPTHPPVAKHEPSEGGLALRPGLMISTQGNPTTCSSSQQNMTGRQGSKISLSKLPISFNH